MNIQITNYGLSVLNKTCKPFNIAQFRLGSNYGYVPSVNATDISGTVVYESTLVGPITVNTNVFKYTIALDYEVGDFTFGEIAYLDDQGQCLAIAVSDRLITKTAQTNNVGNSMRIDTYLSMVGTQYNMWNDNIGSDIDFQVPTLKDVDLLPAVNDTDPNMYLIAPQSSNASSILAYTVGNGLWYFDCYSLSNVQQLSVVRATATSVVFNSAQFTDEQKTQITPAYYGDKVIEFTSGKCYSACRTVVTANIGLTETVLTFRTPMAIVPSPGDTFYLFSRSQVSVSASVLPIATTTNLGGVIVGSGLSITPEGVLSSDPPVTSVNGQIGDVLIDATDISGLSLVATTGSYNDLTDKPSQISYVVPAATRTTLGGIIAGSQFNIATNGLLTLAVNPVLTVNGQSPDTSGNLNIQVGDKVSGLVNPQQIPELSDLNDYTTMGLYYCAEADVRSLVNSPIVAEEFSLEVIALYNGGMLQRASSASWQFIRVLNLNGDWSEWNQVYTKASPIFATTTDPGVITIGEGLYLDDTGKLNAKVKSVNGSTGDVVIGSVEIEDAIKMLYNVEGGVPQLTINPDPLDIPPASENPDDDPPQNMNYNRIGWRHIPQNVPYYLGEWNVKDGTINGDPEQEPDNNGTIKANVGDNGQSNYQTWNTSFIVLKVVVPADTPEDIIADSELDGQIFTDGQYIASIGGKWQPFINPALTGLPNNAPKGTMCYFDGEKWQTIPQGKPGDVLTLNSEGIPAWTTSITPQGGLHIN